MYLVGDHFRAENTLAEHIGPMTLNLIRLKYRFRSTGRKSPWQGSAILVLSHTLVKQRKELKYAL